MLGLRWLVAQGNLSVVERGDGPAGASQGGRAARRPRRSAGWCRARLRAALEETAAFRAYFRTADKDALLRGYLPAQEAP